MKKKKNSDDIIINGRNKEKVIKNKSSHIEIFECKGKNCKKT